MTEKSIIIENLLQDKKIIDYPEKKYETVRIISKVLYEQEVKLKQASLLACASSALDKAFVDFGGRSECGKLPPLKQNT